ncbi:MULTISPECIES: helix-turn-helix domain-containing protein [unclassified Rhodococcus (in: high G+C Gram-positive bacteria)]|uniref:helix-turn-helix domain-containing protein n=1 Tax=unclassified Rhodococcus (in: high G+C Gram-positive bacteria) TaxID=192944 RepID=UPI003392F52C
MNSTTTVPEVSSPNFSKLTFFKSIGGSDLNASQRAVLSTIANFTNERGRGAYPSFDTLLWETGLSKNTVHSAIRVLLAKGWLIVTQRSTGPGMANRYQVAIPAGWAEERARLLELRKNDRTSADRSKLEASACAAVVTESEKQLVEAVFDGKGADNLHQNADKVAPSTKKGYQNLTEGVPKFGGLSDPLSNPKRLRDLSTLHVESAPHPLPEKWQPNTTHRKSATDAGLDIDPIDEEFREWASAGHARSNWDKAFGRYIKGKLEDAEALPYGSY